MLWNEIKSGKLSGYKFNRQKPLGIYIADFYCKKLNLVIEIDGITHINKEEKDKKRQKAMEKFKLIFLRFEDIEVKEDLNGVIGKIEKYIEKFEKKIPLNPPL